MLIQWKYSKPIATKEALLKHMQNTTREFIKTWLNGDTQLNYQKLLSLIKINFTKKTMLKTNSINQNCTLQQWGFSLTEAMRSPLAIIGVRLDPLAYPNLHSNVKSELKM